MMGNMATVVGCHGDKDTSQNAHDEQPFHFRGFPQSSVTWHYWNWTELCLIVNMLIFTSFKQAPMNVSYLHLKICPMTKNRNL